MQIYENVNDNLESYKLAEKILTIYEKIPKIDLKSNHYKDSYVANIKDLKL
jgi:hypothetical protein